MLQRVRYVRVENQHLILGINYDKVIQPSMTRILIVLGKMVGAPWDGALLLYQPNPLFKGSNSRGRCHPKGASTIFPTRLMHLFSFIRKSMGGDWPQQPTFGWFGFWVCQHLSTKVSLAVESPYLKGILWYSEIFGVVTTPTTTFL